MEPDPVFSKHSISVHDDSGDDDVVACQRIVPLVFLEPRGWRWERGEEAGGNQVPEDPGCLSAKAALAAVTNKSLEVAWGDRSLIVAHFNSSMYRDPGILQER